MNAVKLGINTLKQSPLFALFLFIGSCTDLQVDESMIEIQNSSNHSIPDGWSNSNARIDDFEACASGAFCMVAGQHIDAGILEAAHDNDGNIYLTYNTSGGWYLTEVHLFVGHSVKDIPTNKNNHPRVGQFPYKMTFDASEMTSRHQVMIENPHIGTDLQYGCNDLVIAAHAVVVNENHEEETAWAHVCEGDDIGFVTEKFVDKGTWATYLIGDMCIEPCEVDYSYAWEDLKDEGNDQDYNDLVVQAIIWKQQDDGIKTHMKFIAMARGAGYDASLWIALDNGGSEMVFESAKMALPYSLGGWQYNTGDPCNPLPFAGETIIVDGDFTDPLSFMPVITVYPSGTYLDPSGSYDLNIWELAEQLCAGCGQTYTIDGLTYPNGLVIPNDWEWPLESINIQQAYEDFTEVGNWDDDWFTNLSDATKVWDPENAVCD